MLNFHFEQEDEEAIKETITFIFPFMFSALWIDADSSRKQSVSK